MRRFFALVGLLLLALTLQARAQTADPIAQYRADLAQVEIALNEEFALARTRGLLQAAFGAADIGFSQRYLDRWSATVFQRWARMRLLFGASDMRMADWQAAVAAGEVTQEGAEAALAAPMATLLDLAGRIPIWLNDDVARLTERAFWTDLAQSQGCCGAAYYQALHEADQVWAASQSPSAAMIAGLELLPPVGRPDFNGAALAREALARRGAALALEGGDTAAARRAMLNDGALIAELFGDRPATGLGDLAAREGFAAAPVAPLVALARITEPGPLRNTLIAQARIRLEARAAYFDSPEFMAAAPAPAPATPPARRTTTGSANGAGHSVAPVDPDGMPGPGSGILQLQMIAPQAEPGGEDAVADALAALGDDSQAGLSAAASAARAVDALLMPGDVAAAVGY